MSRYQSRDELEEGITLLVKEDRLIDEEINERRLGIFFWILVIVGFSGFVAFFGWDREVVQIITKYFGSRSSTTTTDLYIQASNKYGTFSAPYPWLDSTPGTQLVEPYITSQLTVTGAFASGSTYQWTLDYPSSSDGMEWSGTSTVQEVTLTVPGSYSLSLEAFDAKTGSFRGRYTTLVVCKYVKRELRALSDDDRARLWDASLYMWNTSTSAGRARFGSDFTSIATFASAYMAATGAYRCDSYHDGSAWITHHLALSNAFEASLRAVDPSLSLPYWDFTIEGQEITDAAESPSYLLQVSPLFTPSYLGSANASSDGIADGAWAAAAAPGSLSYAGALSDMAADLSGDSNGWGYLRSYWNLNSAAGVGRHLFDTCGVEIVDHAIPDCAAHFDLLNTAMLETFQLLSPSGTQSALHNQLGGVYGDCTRAYANFSSAWSHVLDASVTEAELVALGYEMESWEWGLSAPRRAMLESVVMAEYHHIYRGLWRSHVCSRDGTPKLLECPDGGSCADRRRARGLGGSSRGGSSRGGSGSDDDDGEDCSCSVPGISSASYDWQNVYYCVVDDDHRALFDTLMPPLLLQELTVLVASTPIVEGDLIDTAGLADPTFWLLAPAMERVLQAKRLYGLDDFAGSSFAKWDSYDGSNETWLSYSYYSQAAGESSYYPEAYTCVGHDADDEVLDASLPLQGGAQQYDLDGDGAVSNWEYFMAVDPNRQDVLDYVFDSFEWEHCRGKV